MNKRPIIVSVVLIISGYSVLLTSSNKVMDGIFGFVTAVGLVIFSISLFHILNKKEE